MAAHTGTVREHLEQLNTDPKTGLDSREAAGRLERDGENRLREARHPGFIQKFFAQLKDVMVLILLGAAAVSFVVALVEPHGEFIDSIIIIAIVFLNALLGVAQESKAEKALDALQELSAPVAKVLRDGAVKQIPSAELVRGDVVVLEAGDVVPADLRLLESASLRCEESALTGESVPAEKDAEAIVHLGAPLGDRRNMAYSGCFVTYGRATGLVTSTGMDTEMGKIAGLLHHSGSEQTPLQQRLAGLGKVLGILALAVCGVIFVVGLLQGMELMDIFMTSVSLAVAAIPEGMTMVVTVVLALGVQRMVKKNAIVRRLPAVETLGSASVICSDKTGTLTQNRMTVRYVWSADGEVEELGGELSRQGRQVIMLGTLCNDGVVTRDADGLHSVGDPTETAIVAAALERGLDKTTLDQEFPRLGEIPFDSRRKRMTTLHQVGDKVAVVVKGGFDVMLPLCRDVDRERCEEINREMGEQGLRVLAVAFRELDAMPEQVDLHLEKDLTFMGLIAMLDPPREESREAVALCASAGIKTVMITGDHVGTAGAIARELGIMREGDRAISGQELAEMSQTQLTQEVDQYAVYARVSPEDKIRIVQAWQERGAVVAMTGDGVNDAPALRAADIGCAMGITGTDVAKGSADMVLTDDNFATIVEAVREGRGIYDNIKKSIQFLLGSNLGEVFTVLFAMLLGWGTPLLAIHLLLVNVVTDALPALALGVEPIDDRIMQRRPIPREEGIFANKLGLVIVLQGLMVAMLTLAGFYVGSNISLSPYFEPSQQIGMTMAFLVLALSQLVQAMNCRSRHSVLRIGFFSNKTMIQGLGFSLIVVLAICLVPALENLFRMVDLSMRHWIWVAGLSITPFIATELVKAVLDLGERHL